ncbi:hypothetical protein [Nocardioides coralli]|uniref:hypothetical protein n=1 Tax=Nocardioides coralli TaxID=2872154 RepID=UPI001CA4107F|nr:hypothetical protein [Nocardioides coralli]QZY28325.1 hypothetical protein K6T13_12685 [Nocardioides coralli]
MSYRLSRVMGAATCAYAAYALARPRHLARALDADPEEGPALDRLARTFGVRDLATSSLLLSSDAGLNRAAVALRIASDLGDCLVLGVGADDPAVRRKVVGVTLGWASLNALAWWVDERG